MNNKCGDNIFAVIERAKEELLRSTNIGDSPDELACLHDFLFRCWQMGWLKQYEQDVVHCYCTSKDIADSFIEDVFAVKEHLSKQDAIKILESKMDGHTDTSYEWAETVRMSIQALEGKNILISVIEQIKAEIKTAARKHLDIALSITDLGERNEHLKAEEALNYCVSLIDSHIKEYTE